MTDQVARRLRSLPGWEEASITKLDGGQSNHSYRISTGERSAVLKLDSNPREWPGNSRAVEAQIQAIAADADLAAAVLWHSEDGILTDWLDGRALDQESLHDRSLLERLGKALRVLHSLPATGHRVRLADWAEYYREHLRQIGSFDADAQAACEHIRETVLPGRAVFSHNDLVPRNIVSGERLRFIDWEYAGDNSWLFDLATLHVEGDLDQGETIALCRAYTGAAEIPRDFDAAVAVYRALLVLWDRAGLPAIT